jgi:hypothetical protein
MIATLTMMTALAAGPITEEFEVIPQFLMVLQVDKIVLHEQYEIVQLRGSDSYQRGVLRQFKFYHKGKLIETLNDSSGKLRPLRIDGEWWLVLRVGDNRRVVTTRCYEYLSTIKSKDKDVEHRVVVPSNDA